MLIQWPVPWEIAVVLLQSEYRVSDSHDKARLQHLRL